MPTGVYKRIKKPYWSGKKFSEEHRQKISKATSIGRKGIKFSEEHLKNLSLSHKGQIPWFKGKTNVLPRREKHHMWKGDSVGYYALHTWVKKELGQPHFCEHCGNRDLTHRQYHWANKSGRYLRRLSDWIRLCVKCHKLYDKR